MNLRKKFAGQEKDHAFAPEKLISLLPVFFGPAALIYLEFVLQSLNDNPTPMVYILLFGAGAGCFLSALTSLIPGGRIRFAVNASLLALLGLLFSTECLVRRSFQVYISPEDLIAGAGNVMQTFSADAWLVIAHNARSIILSFLPLVFYAARFLAAGKMEKRETASTVKTFIRFLVLIVLSFSLTLTGARLVKTGSLSWAYGTGYTFDNATDLYGLLTSLRINYQNKVLRNPKRSDISDFSLQVTWNEELGNFSGARNEIPLEKLELAQEHNTLQAMNRYVLLQESTNKNEYTGLFAGKNLILICAEAFSKEAVNPELTPTLDRLIHNGFYFSDYYQPAWGGSTSTGEYSFLIGLAPRDGANSILHTQNTGLLYTMGNQLLNKGYTGDCFHNGSYTFYARNLTHTNLGYTSYRALGSGLESPSGGQLTDREMFLETIPYYVEHQPFSLYYMTIDGHCTYTRTNPKTEKNLPLVQRVLGDRYADTTLYYLCYQMELEYALEALVKELEDGG